MPDKEEEWWTAGRVAEELEVHRVSVNRIPREDLPYTEHGGRKVRRYDPEVVRAYAATRTAPPDTSLAGILADHERRLADHERRLNTIEDRDRP